MGIAETARAAAMQVECKKDGLSQLQDGSWVLKLKVHPEEMDPAILTAPMGTRYVAALVEIGDDEEPVQRPEKPKGERRWDDLPPAQQAGIRCAEPAFRRFLFEKTGRGLAGEIDAAVVVRERCNIDSRSELNHNLIAAAAWHELDQRFQAWMHA